MSRKLKTFGLALLACVAMSGIGAQGALATSHEFGFDAVKTILTGTSVNSHILEGASAKITCNHVSFITTVEGSAVDQLWRSTPDYKECKMGDNDATFSNKGCEYIFDSDTNDNGHAALDLDCDHSGSLTFASLGCTLHLSDTHTTGADTVNQDMTGLSYANDDAESNLTDDLTIDFTLTGMKTEGTGLGCIALGVGGTRSSFTYSGRMTVRAYIDDEFPHGVEDHAGIRLVAP